MDLVSRLKEGGVVSGRGLRNNLIKGQFGKSSTLTRYSYERRLYKNPVSVK
jgi:hypothetical protein